MPNNPNANAAGLAGGASLLLVYLLHKYAGVNLSLYYAGLIVGAAVTGVLWIGKSGIKGALLRLWNGSKLVWTGSPDAAAPKAAKK